MRLASRKLFSNEVEVKKRSGGRYCKSGGGSAQNAMQVEEELSGKRFGSRATLPLLWARSGKASRLPGGSSSADREPERQTGQRRKSGRETGLAGSRRHFRQVM